MAPALIHEVEDDQTPPAIELTSVEQTFKRLLLDVVNYIADNPSAHDGESQVNLPPELAKQDLVLRFAGGWVRDKLLGTQSHDIDVAINKMTGYHFGLRLKEYLEVPGNLEKYGLQSIAANDKQSQSAKSSDKSKTVGGLHKIKANPEKSKNLETTTMHILGLDVDLVNLRKEVYDKDSRNPRIEFGTPEEDAERRDATVNAMFYNVNTGCVEDLTGKGHDDMRQRVLRTPLEPRQTFMDDPLRVLRLIRFASRLDYSIDPQALSAMRQTDIKEALRRKISRERVGIELEKALRGPNPHEAMRLIFSLDLYDTIFSDPAVTSTEHYEPETEGWEVVINALKDAVDGDGSVAETLIRDNEEQYLAWQLAALVPYRNAPQPDSSDPRRKAPPPISVQVAREGVKATSKTCDLILHAVRNQAEISTCVDNVSERKRRPDKKFQGPDPGARDVLGMALRKWGQYWRSQVVYAMLVDISNNIDQAEAIERRYAIFTSQLRELDLLEVCSLKPLIDGTALAKALETRPGPWMADALEVVMAWQLRHPQIKDPQAAIEEVKLHRKSGELTFELIRRFLKLTIRPVFIKASPSSITEQGRRVVTETLPKKLTLGNTDDDANKPWKSADGTDVLNILGWVVKSLDADVVEEVWPLVIPPILALIDDWEPKYKRMGADLLQTLLQTTPSTLLQKTGLGEVFEEALMPCLTYLPTITPEDDSIALLRSVYPALLTLTLVRFPRHANMDLTAPFQHEWSRQRNSVIDKVIRRGIIYGCAHCSAYPKILALLFDQLSTLLDNLGIDSVKHIKYLLPSLVETLSHPLATSSPFMLNHAILALQSLIRNCWPRMVEHRVDVLKGLTVCWVRLQDSSSSHLPQDAAADDGFEQLRARLKEALEMLSVAMVATPGSCDFQADCAALLAAEPRLEGLFAGLSR